jgi:hypothetical protein
MKEFLFELLIAFAYWWFVCFLALLVAWYLGLVWSALLFAVMFVPYYKLMRRLI